MLPSTPRARRAVPTAALLAVAALLPARLPAQDEAAAAEVAEPATSAAPRALPPRAVLPEPELRKPSPEVLQAVRLVVSGSEADQARGVAKLRLLGKSIAPELRYWLDSTRLRARRVEAVLGEIEGDGGDRVRRQRLIDEYLSERVEDARELAREGHYRSAQQLAEAVLTLDPDGPRSWETRRFVRDCRARLASRELLEPSFEIPRRVYEVGERPALLFRLRNHTRKPAEIRLERGVIGEATVVISRQSAGGDASRQETRAVVRAEGNPPTLKLGPGKAWECQVPLDLGAPMPLAGAVARVIVKGRFRPTRWTAENENENLTLEISPLELWIVPPGQIALGDRPLEKMTAALLFGRDEAFFVGGQLAVWVGEQDDIYNGKVVETLIAHLESLQGARLALATRLLAHATGVDCGPDAAKWVAWWSKFRDAGGDAPTTEPAN